MEVCQGSLVTLAQKPSMPLPSDRTTEFNRQPTLATAGRARPQPPREMRIRTQESLQLSELILTANSTNCCAGEGEEGIKGIKQGEGELKGVVDSTDPCLKHHPGMPLGLSFPSTQRFPGIACYITVNKLAAVLAQPDPIVLSGSFSRGKRRIVSGPTPTGRGDVSGHAKIDSPRFLELRA